MTPVRGKVTLERGRNLVTWLGPDGWTIERVVQGIGRAFVRADWGQHVYRPASSASADRSQVVGSGDALWIEVSRRVTWLQPAGVLPRVVFAGDASADTMKSVRQDSADAMQYFLEQFSVQPDGSLLTVYVAADVESLIDAFKKDGIGTDGVHATWYTAGGWASSLGHIVLKSEQWDPEYSVNRHSEGDHGLGRYVLVHEYYHAIQQQMSSTNAAQWLVEGGADWAEAGVRLKDADSTFDEVLAGNRNSASSAEAPPLNHTERKVGTWHYTLGALASHRLALRSGKQALVEFWRALLPESLGPLGRWQSNPPWQDVFQDVFGFSVEGFYSEFAEWRGNLAPLVVRGHVLDPDGQGLPYVRIVGRSPRLEDEGHDYFNTISDRDGSFVLSVSGLGFAEVGVDLGGCQVHYTSNGFVSGWYQAEQLSTTEERSQNLRLQLSQHICVWQVSGQLLDPQENGISNQWIYAESDGGGSVNARTESDGAFSITVPFPGQYRLRTSIEGCSVYYRQDEAPGTRQQATQLSLDGGDVIDVPFQLTEGLCSTKITGRLLDADGIGIPDVWVYARDENNSSASARTESDGSFSITVPGPGVFRLENSMDGCWVYFRRGGAVSSRDQATRITVDDRDVTGVRFQLREGQCSTKITGQLLDADDDPLANVRVWAQPENGTSSGAQTDSDGSFSITVPEAGQYRVSTRIDGCSVYYRRSGITANWNQATQIRVSDSDVTGIRIQLTEGMCEHRISGTLLNADGTPRSGQWVSASGNAGSGGASTAADGSFSFAVPGNGSYRLSVWIDECSIYHGSRGPTKNWNSASQVRVSNADVTGIEFRLPENPASFCN